MSFLSAFRPARVALFAWKPGLLGLLLGLALISPSISAQQQELPTLGLGSSYSISLHQEAALGQAWLRRFRAQTEIYYDPLLQNYLEGLVTRLASYHTGLDEIEQDLVVVDQPQLNAFAVPGGILGVHTGLFAFASHEDELASVLAHELAHLSQRHYARRVEASQGAQWSTLAGLLAGILVASQGHADAGMAAIAGTQAAAIQEQLAWSRTYEHESDRLGMETLAAAGFSPEAMPSMFEEMQKLTSLNGRPPEFLMTHPLTASRIADAWARADQLNSSQPRIKGRDYELLRVRILFHQASSPATAYRRFMQEQASPAAARYAAILKVQAEGQSQQAQQEITAWAAEHPQWLLAQVIQAEILLQEEELQAAVTALKAILAFSPEYYPALYLLAQAHTQAEDWQAAQEVWQDLTRRRPEDPRVWYQLAEVAGQAGHSIQVHQARAEYLQLTGRFRQARSQLELALEKAREQQAPWQRQEVIRQRQRELQALQERLDV
ncbi:M48 family metalloprotease [Marinospirillum perlucidum]|uniref:M48 family metalloprotease n=1 Tax=Marinospirillum perlucidum TaxID=1982602 RepID=UPI000DF481E3|nr:M48 family metalloprotease [Marinospirillum perlucidum]